MINRITDPGFEAQSPAHLFSFQGRPSTNWARSGLWSALMPHATGEVVGAWWYQAITTNVGQTYPFSVWLQLDGQGGKPVGYWVSHDAGASWTRLDFTAGSGTVLWEPVDVVAASTTLYVRVSNDSPDEGDAFFMDDLYLDGSLDNMARYSKWTALQNIKTTLKTINGASGGFYTDLANRVYTRLFTPNEMTATALPYVCIPLVDDNETADWLNDRVANSKWQQPFWAFFAETSSNDSKDSPAVQSVAQFRDDIYRALMTDPTLSGAVRDCRLVSLRSTAGVTDDYAELQGVIELDQIFQRSDLGV